MESSFAESIPLELGVPQGDVLSPDLFNLYVDNLPERLIAACRKFGGSPRYGGVVIPVVMYADDQALLHCDPEAIQAMLDICQQYATEHFYSWPSLAG